MNFFDYIKNDAFFKPLTLKYRRVYYDCIQILITRMKELPVLYEADARDSITLYLRNMEVSGTDREGTGMTEASEAFSANTEYPHEAREASGIDQGSLFFEETGQGQIYLEASGSNASDSDNRSPYRISPDQEDLRNQEENTVELQAGGILALFRECGWILPREIGRNGEYVVNISSDCRKCMDFLRKLTEKTTDGMMSNRIFSMYEIMKSAFEEDSVRRERPYTNILIPLMENAYELKNELSDLKDSISGIMKAVVAFQDINSFGQYIMKDHMLDRFFSEYFFVKNNGLIPAQLSLIKDKLRLLRQGEVCERILRECAEKLQLEREEAQERIEAYFSELQYFLAVEYEENMELIDNRINNYYNLANTRIMLMAGNGVKLEAEISDFLNAVAGLTEEEQRQAMERTADCTRIIHQQYVGSKSFEKKQRIRREGENIGFAAEDLSEEEKRLRTESLFQAAKNRYSVERVTAFLDTQLGSRDRLSLGEQEIRTKEEALMYAAAMLYANHGEFPYEIRWTEEILQTKVADMSHMTVRKR